MKLRDFSLHEGGGGAHTEAAAAITRRFLTARRRRRSPRTFSLHGGDSGGDHGGSCGKVGGSIVGDSMEVHVNARVYDEFLFGGFLTWHKTDLGPCILTTSCVSIGLDAEFVVVFGPVVPESRIGLDVLVRSNILDFGTFSGIKLRPFLVDREIRWVKCLIFNSVCCENEIITFHIVHKF
jgi:hypothetical protein